MPKTAPVYGLSFVVLLAIGWFFYFLVRGLDPTGLLQPASAVENQDFFVIINTFPSFVHGLGMFFLFRLLFRQKREFWVAWIATTLGFELAQSIFSLLGTFDIADLIAIGVSGYIGHRWILCPTRFFKAKWMQCVGFLIAIGTSLATSKYEGEKLVLRAESEPICMTRAELKKVTAVAPPKSIRVAGKIFEYKNFLFISEPYVGVHVYDNRDPTKPIPRYFLNIPGNMDIVVHSNFLYADSADDLLSFELSEQRIVLVGRQNSVLPENLWNVSPEGDFSSRRLLESCRDRGGLVVGFKQNAKTE